MQSQLFSLVFVHVVYLMRSGRQMIRLILLNSIGISMWLIDCFGFYAVPVIFQPCNGGYFYVNVHSVCVNVHSARMWTYTLFICERTLCLYVNVHSACMWTYTMFVCERTLCLYVNVHSACMWTYTLFVCERTLCLYVNVCVHSHRYTTCICENGDKKRKIWQHLIWEVKWTLYLSNCLFYYICISLHVNNKSSSKEYISLLKKQIIANYIEWQFRM